MCPAVPPAAPSSVPNAVPTAGTPGDGRQDTPPRVVVMGVSGSGKSTIGVALAQHLGVPYADADDLHPQANIDKMSAGEALDDDDRHPWLEVVGQWLADHPDGGVMGCSALKRRYRDQLRSHAPGLLVVHLDGDREVIAARQADRPGHYMPSSLLASQFATLEPLAPDEAGVVVDIADGVEQVVADAVEALGRLS